eukprot:TRINITY_DN7792_c0_g1_i1.p1 TRINITY_DN7792_c0_g1~~TRINITY_DN7792_c0_g1_i1.p1  ORF type:complete len:397 (+),score=83.77 TRINITY_DN7792_c0_g1_i1:64-1254(+)
MCIRDSFLTSDGSSVKLGDLNVSKVAKNNLVYTQTGTPYYASPEVWQDKPYDNKSDIWSLGCVLYEMTALRPPFRANDMQGLFKKVQKGVYDKIPTRYSADLSAVIAACLRVSPATRPTCKDLLAMAPLQRNSVDQEEPEQVISSANLLNTIKMPKNIRDLGKLILPKANYNIPDDDLDSPLGPRPRDELPKIGTPVLPREKVQKPRLYSGKESNRTPLMPPPSDYSRHVNRNAVLESRANAVLARNGIIETPSKNIIASNEVLVNRPPRAMPIEPRVEERKARAQSGHVQNRAGSEPRVRPTADKSPNYRYANQESAQKEAEYRAKMVAKIEADYQSALKAHNQNAGVYSNKNMNYVENRNNYPSGVRRQNSASRPPVAVAAPVRNKNVHPDWWG